MFSDPCFSGDLQDFNKQIVWFAPRGECAEDQVAVFRTPGNLRTIFGSNTDNKLIAGAVAETLLPATLLLTRNEDSAGEGSCR